MYKQAGWLSGALNVGDSALRGLGRLFGAGGRYRKLAESPKFIKGVTAAGDPMLNAANIKTYNKLRAAQAKAERIGGGIVLGGTSVAVPTAAALSASSDKAAAKTAMNEAIASHAMDKHKYTNQLKKRQRDEAEAAASAKGNSSRALASAMGWLGVPTMAGGTLGALIDRRNRLRGFLIGSLFGGSTAAAVMALKGFDKYDKAQEAEDKHLASRNA